MPRSVNVLKIEEAIAGNQITFEECQVIVQGLRCVDHGVIQPGTQFLQIGRTSIDLAPCSFARAELGEEPMTSPASMIVDYFPSRNHSDLPIWCLECKSFAPALKALKKLLLKS